MGRETIYALSSGGLPSGVAVIRLSGPRVRFVVETLCGAVPGPRRASLRRLRDPSDGGILDEALVIVFEGPASFTGEDVAEFHLHGGRAVVSAVLRVLEGIEGLSPAAPGAFTRRAFEGRSSRPDGGRGARRSHSGRDGSPAPPGPEADGGRAREALRRMEGDACQVPAR